MKKLNKRSLAKIKNPSITTLESDQAVSCLFTTECHIIDKTQVYILNGYKKQDSVFVYSFRAFFSDTDYIIQTFRDDGYVWHKATMWYYCADNAIYLHHNKTFFHTKKDYNKFLAFVKRKTKHEKKPYWSYFSTTDEVWILCDIYQLRIRAKRRLENNQYDMSVIDKELETIKKRLPKQFYRWTDKNAFPEYLVYQAKGNSRHTITCQCTACGKKFEAERHILHIKHNKETVCPECKRTVICKASGLTKKELMAEANIIYIDPQPNGFCVRFVRGWRAVKLEGNTIHSSVKYKETAREMFTMDSAGNLKNKGYQYDNYKKTGLIRWCRYREHNFWFEPRKDFFVYDRQILYPENLPYAFGDTPLRYFQLEVLSKRHTNVPTGYWRILYNSQKYCGIEHLIKNGFFELAEEHMNAYYINSFCNMKGRSLKDVLRFTNKGKRYRNKAHIQFIKQTRANNNQLGFVQMCYKHDVPYTEQDMHEYLSIFNPETDIFEIGGKHASVHKITQYIKKMAIGTQTIRDTCRDWMDYLRWCRELNRNLDDSYYYFPPNLKKEHDRMYKLIQERRKIQEHERYREKYKKEYEQMAERIKDMTTRISAILKQGERSNVFYVTGTKYVLMIPENADALWQEGETQHHCVSSYIGKIARGECFIFFIRKSTALDKPFYTMEYLIEEERIEQCRGKGNSSMTSDVEAFTEVFEKKMQKSRINIA